MGVEIERKFLVTNGGWRQPHPLHLIQGYLNLDPARTVRIRTDGVRAFLTVKGPTRGATRSEFEYAVPRPDAESLLALCAGARIDKLRHVIAAGGARWEVDEFLGDNAGLVVAEIELASEDQAFARPGWLGREVTDDARYYNSNLAQHPYRTWARAAIEPRPAPARPDR
ncbi:MAG TPA: CYTH domain-containing protein [Rhodanobacteraceae bacterium]